MGSYPSLSFSRAGIVPFVFLHIVCLCSQYVFNDGVQARGLFIFHLVLEYGGNYSGKVGSKIWQWAKTQS